MEGGKWRVQEQIMASLHECTQISSYLICTRKEDCLNNLKYPKSYGIGLRCSQWEGGFSIEYSWWQLVRKNLRVCTFNDLRLLTKQVTFCNPHNNLSSTINISSILNIEKEGPEKFSKTIQAVQV